MHRNDELQSLVQQSLVQGNKDKRKLIDARHAIEAALVAMDQQHYAAARVCLEGAL